MPTTISGSTGVSQVQDGVITVEDLNGGGSGSAPIYGCRAWVNFDGTRDSTGAASTANTNRLIRASGNVASVLRNGAGDYTITFTTAMLDANYSALPGAASPQQEIVSQSTNGVRFYTAASNGALLDATICNVLVFR